MTTSGKNTVNMTVEDVDRLINEIANSLKEDGSSDLMISAITIEDALFLLSCDSRYIVNCADSSTAGKPEKSFYLMKLGDPTFCRWIVYKD